MNLRTMTISIVTPSLMYRLTLVIAFAILLSASSVAQPTPTPSATYPNWTGARYPFGQHLAVMVLHLDNAALAMARRAQQTAKSDSVKKLAVNVIAERTRDIDVTRTYSKKYGQEPPSWPTPANGYGPGMMGGNGGPGMMGGNGGPGMMGGNGGPGMMGYGDSYQMMMGWQSNWWGSANSDEGFVAGLMRLDAMEISMATLGLTASDADTMSLARRIVSARAAELQRLVKSIKS